MQIRKNKLKKLVLPVSLAIAIILFSIVPLFRTISYDSLYPGSEPYYHARIAEYIYENNIPVKDPLMPRPYIFDPYHLLLAIAIPLVGLYATSALIPFSLGILSIILIYLILKKLKLPLFEVIAILLIFIISPVSIYLYSTSNAFALPLFLSLLVFYLFIRSNWIYILPLIFLAPYNPLFAFATVAAIISYSFNKKDYRRKLYIAVFLAFIPLVYNSFLYFTHTFSSLYDITKTPLIINIMSDFGSKTGFGMFHILLSMVGLFAVWKIKKQLLPYSLMLIFIIISWFYTPLNTYLNVPLSMLAGYGFIVFVKRKWDTNLLKKLTILVLICGLLFSSLSYVNRLSHQQPSKDIIKSLEWFAGQEKGIVLSSPSNGYWIESITEKPALLDTDTIFLKNAAQKSADSSVIFSSRNLETTKSLLEKNDISYIWITEEMKQGQIWTKEDQGLLFLLQNNETFKNLYSSSHAEIWEIIK